MESISQRFEQLIQIAAVTRHIAETAVEVARDAVAQSNRTNALSRITRAKSRALQDALSNGKPIP